MMFQWARSVIFGVALVCTSVSFANQELTCPSTNSIKLEGVTGASEFIGSYQVFHNSPYDSQRLWCFVMMFFDTKTADEAIQQGNYHLSKLSGFPTPFVYNTSGDALCNYDDIETGTKKLIAYAGTLPCEDILRIVASRVH